MKKIMTMLALTLMLTTSFAFAGETINKQALKAFKSEFAGATDIAWKVGSNYYEVAFTINDQRLFAFYNDQGEFMAVTQFISSTQMPNYLRKSLKRSYSNFWISDLFEMTNDDETSFYVTLENADTKVILKSIDGNKWSLYNKIDKE